MSNVEAMTRAAGPQWTNRKLLEQMVLGSRQAPLVGSAERIADELIAWIEETGVDGFNLSRTVAPECFEDFVELVVPILQERGVYKRAYRDGTLREKLFGHARLPSTHTGAQYRSPLRRRRVRRCLSNRTVMHVFSVSCAPTHHAHRHRAPADFSTQRLTCLTRAPSATRWPDSAPPSTSLRATARQVSPAAPRRRSAA